MNHLQRLIKDSKNMEAYVRGYIKYLSQMLSRVDIKKIVELKQIIDNARESEKTIYLAGNGGSAATVSSA